MQRRLTAAAVALSATALIMGINPASATPTDPTTPIVGAATSAEAAALAAPATPATVTLPLFGAPLTVDITTGPGGVLATVAVNPADGLTATMLKPNRVVFVNEEGTARVVVNARGGNQKIEARAGSLAEVSGPGGWTGVLCDGTAAQIDYTVAEDGSLSAVTASPEPERVPVNASKIQVRFTRLERIHIRARGDDGELKISIDEKIRCHDAPPPSVNTEVAPDAVRPDDDDDDRRDRDRDRGGNNDERHRGDDDSDDNSDDNGDENENRGGNGKGGGRDGHRDGDD